jgi:hypothetical protein
MGVERPSPLVASPAGYVAVNDEGPKLSSAGPPPPKQTISTPKSILALFGAILLLLIVGKACGDGEREDSSSTSTSPSSATSAAPTTPAATPTTPRGPKPPANVEGLTFDVKPGPNGDIVTAKFKIAGGFTRGTTKDGARIDTVDILKYAQAAYPNLAEVDVDALSDMVDIYGRTSVDQVVVTLTYSRATLDKINWDNFHFENIWNIPIADSAYVHPAFQY